VAQGKISYIIRVKSFGMKPTHRINKVLFYLGLSLPLLALVAVGWLAHHTTVQFRDSFYWVTRTYEILNVLEQTESHIVDAEVGRRGYLLTGRKDYLIPYDNATSLIRNDIQQLKTLAGGGMNQRTHIAELQNLVAEQLSLDPETIAGSKTNSPDALAIMLTEQGKATMDKISRVLFRMREEEGYWLNVRQQRTEDNAISSEIASIALIGAVAIMLIFIVIIRLRLERLQRVVTICAWTGLVYYEGQWIRMDEYLQRRFGLSVSHGLSKEASAKIIAEIKESNRPGGERPPG
jgi:CHASE3 domain sensor protein